MSKAGLIVAAMGIAAVSFYAGTRYGAHGAKSPPHGASDGRGASDRATSDEDDPARTNTLGAPGERAGMATRPPPCVSTSTTTGGSLFSPTELQRLLAERRADADAGASDPGQAEEAFREAERLVDEALARRVLSADDRAALGALLASLDHAQQARITERIMSAAQRGELRIAPQP